MLPVARSSRAVHVVPALYSLVMNKPGLYDDHVMTCVLPPTSAAAAGICGERGGCGSWLSWVNRG